MVHRFFKKSLILSILDLNNSQPFEDNHPHKTTMVKIQKYQLLTNPKNMFNLYINNKIQSIC